MDIKKIINLSFCLKAGSVVGGEVKVLLYRGQKLNWIDHYIFDRNGQI
jgi:hypothetical protein